MRTNRTPPLALPLAVLAGIPLLLGCVEDELEPVDELPEATRGGYVWCRVTGGLDYDSTRFEWYTERGGNTHSRIGDRGAEWGGYATETLGITVEIYRDTPLANFRSDVVAHEYEHQNSLNKCIRAVNRRLMGHVEEAVGGQRHVKDVLEHTWRQVVDDLLDAKETAQGSISADNREHRRLGRWTDGVLTTGHSGTDGC